MIDTLLELGFSKNDALVYEALLKSGPTFVAPLVRYTKKHRQIVYNSLGALMGRHLVTMSKKNGKNFYSSTDPERILTEIRQKEVAAQSLLRSIEEKHKAEHEQVEVFVGSTSYEQATVDFRQRARDAKEYIVIRGEIKDWFEHARSFFDQHVQALKSLKHEGIDIQILFFEKDRKYAVKFLGSYLNDPYTCKIIPDQYHLPHSAWLAGDHVYILTPAVDPIVVHIKSKALAAQYREYFWNIWGKGKMLK